MIHDSAGEVSVQPRSAEPSVAHRGVDLPEGMTEPLDQLLLLDRASQDLASGNHAAVISALEGLADQGGQVGRALLLVARGFQALAEGRSDEGGALLERAFSLGPALPAAALRAIVGHFRQSERWLLAHHAFLMLQLLEPDLKPGSTRHPSLEERARYAPWAVRQSLTTGRAATYQLAQQKAALRHHLGPEGAAHALAGLHGPQGARHAVRRRLTPLIDHAREVGLDFEELIGAGEVAPATIHTFGRPDAELPGPRRARSLFGSILEDVVVTGRSGILLTGERALMDIQDDELSRRPHDLSVDPIIAAADVDKTILLEPADRDALPRVPEAVWLGGVGSVAFGHWVIEFLPKVWALMTRPGFGTVPLLLDARMPRQHLEAVRIFAGVSNPVIVLEPHDNVRVERLWVASALAYLPVGPLPAPPGPRARMGLDDAGFRRLMERVTPALDAIDITDAPPRLYLGRRPTQHRHLDNADEIEALVERAGFRILYFEELPFSEQLRLVRGAEWIIGPTGSALENVIFGRPGLRVGVLVPRGPEDVQWVGQCARALSIDLTALVGEILQEHPSYLHLSDYRVDPGLVAAYLDTPAPGPPRDGSKPLARELATIPIWSPSRPSPASGAVIAGRAIGDQGQ